MNEPFAHEYLIARGLTARFTGILALATTGWFHTPVGPSHPIPVPRLEGPFVAVMRESGAESHYNRGTVVESFGTAEGLRLYVERIFRDSPGEWKVLGLFDCRGEGKLLDWAVTTVTVALVD